MIREIPPELEGLSTRALNCLLFTLGIYSKATLRETILSGKLHPEAHFDGGCRNMGWKTFDEFCDFSGIARFDRNDEKSKSLIRERAKIRRTWTQ